MMELVRRSRIGSGRRSRWRAKRRRAVTLLELIIAMSLLSVLILGNLYALSTARRLMHRNEVLTRLTMRANADLARLRAGRWEDLRPGSRPLPNDENLPAAVGQVTVREMPQADLKEITVVWVENTKLGPCQVVLATWRAKE